MDPSTSKKLSQKKVKKAKNAVVVKEEAPSKVEAKVESKPAKAKVASKVAEKPKVKVEKVVFECDVSAVVLRLLQKVYPKLKAISFVAGKVGYCFGMFETVADINAAIAQGLVSVSPELSAKAELARRPQNPGQPTAFLSFTKIAFLADAFQSALQEGTSPSSVTPLAVQGIVSSAVLVKLPTPEAANALRQKGSFMVLGDIPVKVSEPSASIPFDKKKSKENQTQSQTQKPSQSQNQKKRPRADDDEEEKELNEAGKSDQEASLPKKKEMKLAAAGKTKAKLPKAKKQPK